MYSFTVDEITNAVKIFCDGSLSVQQPFNPDTGERFTKEEAVAWATAEVESRNAVIVP